MKTSLAKKLPVKVTFYDAEYCLSHGAHPKGRGSWAFQIQAINHEDGNGEIHFTPSLTLTEAKRFIKPILIAEAKSINAAARWVDVQILP